MIWQAIDQATIHSPDQIKDLIQKWKHHFGLTSLILLSGELGAGKTEFVKQWGKLYGIEGIASPTFALHHSYGNIQHYDLYRIESKDDLETIGLWDVLAEKNGHVLIEWPERVADSDWPTDWSIFKIQILKLSETNRQISLFRYAVLF